MFDQKKTNMAHSKFYSLEGYFKISQQNVTLGGIKFYRDILGYSGHSAATSVRTTLLTIMKFYLINKIFYSFILHIKCIGYMFHICVK